MSECVREKSKSESVWGCQREKGGVRERERMREILVRVRERSCESKFACLSE